MQFSGHQGSPHLHPQLQLPGMGNKSHLGWTHTSSWSPGENKRESKPEIQPGFPSGSLAPSSQSSPLFEGLAPSWISSQMQCCQLPHKFIGSSDGLHPFFLLPRQPIAPRSCGMVNIPCMPEAPTLGNLQQKRGIFPVPSCYSLGKGLKVF